ncbi:hypothetical protein ASD37_25640 [Mycobacterium sp. Root135]|uniref:hypothetical protein n=1 Tax=Mycobacterium sp. Root135 TaxID=1736457 RepID=UPI0006FAC194|nr:hypothetical protein [Mycobacterium sp. Root135]KQY02934.1 hypothetical protein ASD37_25640 [Mycobacterium sp. Root135]
MITPHVDPRSGEQHEPETEPPFARLFDSQLFDDHAPLLWGWSESDLTLVLDRLAHLLPANLPGRMQMAVAASALSIAVEKRRTGGGVHYARAKDAYGVPARYRCDPSRSWHYTTRSVDILIELGLIDQELGLWCPGAEGSETVAWAAGDLMTVLGSLVDMQDQVTHSRPEVIVLRDREDKKRVDYTETVETIAMRREVEYINDALARLQLGDGQGKVHIPPLRRVFNGSFERGGRHYCHGDSFQNMPSERRRQLQIAIDGVVHPVVEVDYSNLHVEMAYRRLRRRIRPGDQYAIPGFSRSLVKVAVNTVLNATSRLTGVRAIADELHKNRDLRELSGVGTGTRSQCHKLAERVVAALERKHRRIKALFGSDSGAEFQRKDSDMAVQIMKEMIRRTGRCPLPVHDSFLVADSDEQELVRVMREVALSYRLRPTLKVLRRGEPAALLPYMEVTTSDLHQWERHSGREMLSRGARYANLTTCSRTVLPACRAGSPYGRDPPLFIPQHVADNRGTAQVRADQGPRRLTCRTLPTGVHQTGKPAATGERRGSSASVRREAR